VLILILYHEKGEQVKTWSREQNSDLSDIGEVWTEVLPRESPVRFPLVSTIPPIPHTPFIFEAADIGRTDKWAIPGVCQQIEKYQERKLLTSEC